MENFLDIADFEFRRLKDLGDKAMAQVPPDAFHQRLDQEGNSLAVLVQHLAGNMRSRWTDFLTSDGEKPWRERDAEFRDNPASGHDELLRAWEAGWACLFSALSPLSSTDLDASVVIRGEPHTVQQAICRQLTHYAYHVGQMVLLARHLSQGKWRSLSIPPEGSREFNESPRPYRAP